MKLTSKPGSMRAVLVISVCAILIDCLPVAASSWLGSGTELDPYLIHDANDLGAIAGDTDSWDAHFKLMADIDLPDAPEINLAGTIGRWDDQPFTGVFDGNHHTISNIFCNKQLSGFALFGFVGEDGEITNLGVEDVDIDVIAGANSAPLVAHNHGTVTNCYATGKITGDIDIAGLVAGNAGVIQDSHSMCVVDGKWGAGGLVATSSGEIRRCYAAGAVDADFEGEAGGLVGTNVGGIISNSHATGTTTGSSKVGGLAGRNQSAGTIAECYATGKVIGTYDNIGGLVGDNHLGSISGCYTAGTVEGRNRVGGLAGLNSSVIAYCYTTASVYSRFFPGGGLVGQNEEQAIILTCYSSGSVRGGYIVGGLVGVNNQGVVEDSFWDSETSGSINMCGLGSPNCDNAYGKTTLEMRMMSTFTSAGWDFAGETDNGTEDIWKMRCEGMSYPRLSWWQPADADFVCPDGVDFVDFSYLANFWRADNCADTNGCSQTDLDESGSIGPGDLAVFIGSWLTDVE